MYLVFTRVPGYTSGGVYVPCIYTRARIYLWWSLRTLYLHACQDIPLVEFTYLVFTRVPGYTSGGVYVPCIYTHVSENYRRGLRSWLLCLFRALINSLTRIVV